MNALIFKEIEKLNTNGIYPMHMPGHKRNSSFLDLGNPCLHDITEIEGYDNLHDANGIILDAMKKASVLYGSKESYFLVNGSTCGILAGIFAATKRGDTVLVARNCHKSVYNAINLSNLNADYVFPETDPVSGIAGSINPDDIKTHLKNNNKISLIVITSPTYDGVVSDIKAIADIAHKNNIPLLVDEAHGAHLGFNSYFPKGAVNCSTDIVIQSLHKTLPAFTQTAVLHLNGSLISSDSIKNYLSVFETSSPSYLLMASAEYCIDLLYNNRDNLFDSFVQKLNDFNASVKNLSKLLILNYGKDSLNVHQNFYDFDKSKIIISTKNTSINGNELYCLLLNKYKIQPEMYYTDYVLCMTSVCDTKEGLSRLSSALNEIDASINCNNRPSSAFQNIPLPEIKCKISTALSRESEIINIKNAAGKTMQEYIYAYPPGIPISVPGEIITDELIKLLSELNKYNIALKSSSKNLPCIKCIKD